jgi:TIR domain
VRLRLAWVAGLRFVGWIRGCWGSFGCWGVGMVSGHADKSAGPGRAGDFVNDPVSVFVSYAHDDGAHVERVREFWWFLRSNGVDAQLDLPAAEQRQDWGEWMTRQVRDAERVLVVASPEYKRRAEGDAGPDEGRGVQWEARLIRGRFYADQKRGLQAVVPVVLPGGSAGDVPLWLAPTSTTCYTVSEFTVAGAEALLRLLTSQPGETVPPIGPVPVLPPHAPPGGVGVVRPALRTEMLIEAEITGDGQLASTVWVAGAGLGERRVPLPDEVNHVWAALQLPPAEAADRVTEAGRRLGAAVLGEADGQRLATLLHTLPPGGEVQVVLAAVGPGLALPVELIRLATAEGVEVGPLGLLPGVSVSRRPAAPSLDGQPEPGEPPGAVLAGPLKVLAAVAAPDETKTKNVPLDVEAEMQAVLDAVTDLAGHPGAQVRMVAELTPGYPSRYAAICAVAKKLGIGTAETLRKWVRWAEVDAGERPGATSAGHAEIKRLKREVAELRRANEI